MNNSHRHHTDGRSQAQRHIAHLIEVQKQAKQLHGEASVVVIAFEGPVDTD